VSSISGSLPRTYAYDNAGNTLSYAGATFTYNNRGRMKTASNAGTTATYTYNALGQRVRRATSSVTTLYAYDEVGHLVGEYTSAGVLIQETVWLGDVPIATLRPNGSGGVVLYYVHADHLNTPRLVTDSANNIVWRWDSDAFGTTPPNENPSGLGMFEYNLRFPGQQYDAVVGLHYNYFREYDPAKGGYVESDPIGLRGGVNTYLYAEGEPVDNDDPDGLRRRPPRERIPDRYREPSLPPWLRNPIRTERLPPPHVVPGMNEILKRNLEEFIENYWVDMINFPQQQRGKRASERLLHWMKKNPFDDSYCGANDSDRLNDYFEELRRMHRIFQREMIPGK
jgi:RHS repeat-associated protein